MKVRSRTILYMGVVGLTACVHEPILPRLSEQAYTAIAKDATQQLARIYPPAKTHLVFESRSDTLFDKSLKDQLRNQGYALHDGKTKSAEAQQLSYILDALTNFTSYGYVRMTLTIDQAQLSRLYDSQDLSQPNTWTYRP
jgi:hypothetical protein